MPATNQDIGVDPAAPYFSGDSLEIALTIFKADGETPEDISGAAITWQAFRAAGSVSFGAALITKMVGSGITITDGPNGVAKIAILPEDTEALEGDHYHEAQATFVGGVVSTVMTGRWVIRRDAVQ